MGVGRTSGVSAASTSSSPAPARVGSTRDVAGPTGRAVTVSAAFTCAGLQSGWRWSSSATAPETCGAAMLVPERVPQPSGWDERMAVPGATTSGFSLKDRGVGPEEENPAIDGDEPDVDAPTVIASAADPGDVSDPAPNSSKSFPAATTGTTPAAAAASSASATTSCCGVISGSPIERLITSIPSWTAASIAATSSGALPSSPTFASVGTVSAL